VYNTFRCNTVTSDTHMDAFRKQYVAFLRPLVSLLLNVHMMDFPLVLNRFAKVLLSTLSVLLPTQSDIGTGPVSVTSSKGRKSRKRAHDYEGDELFKTTINVICPTSEHNAMILTTLDGTLRTSFIYKHSLTRPTTQPFDCFFAIGSYHQQRIRSSVEWCSISTFGYLSWIPLDFQAISRSTHKFCAGFNAHPWISAQILEMRWAAAWA
jgi:hypothetical protein